MEDDDLVVKKLMHIFTKAPHGTIYSYEGVEMVLINATYEQDISLVFIDDGVYSLKKGQNTEGIGIKGFANIFPALDGYDVEKLYVDKQSMEDRGLTEDDFLVDVEVLEADQIGKMMKEMDAIIPH